jgi:hypothetical protein
MSRRRAHRAGKHGKTSLKASNLRRKDMAMSRDKLTIIPPGKPLSGRAVPPGSKSITNRALLLAGLAKGTSR